MSVAIVYEKCSVASAFASRPRFLQLIRAEKQGLLPRSPLVPLCASSVARDRMTCASRCGFRESSTHHLRRRSDHAGGRDRRNGLSMGVASEGLDRFIFGFRLRRIRGGWSRSANRSGSVSGRRRGRGRARIAGMRSRAFVM
jgi:hypothetical protein